MTEIELLRKQVAELMDRVLELEKDQRRIVQHPIRDWTPASPVYQPHPMYPPGMWPFGPSLDPTWAQGGTGAAPPKSADIIC